MKKILLVNPPVYDFTAYDFWLKPFGLLKIGGYLRSKADLSLFDFLDRKHPSLANAALKADRWGRGKFPSFVTEKPPPLRSLPQKFRRFGLPLKFFRSELETNGPYDFILIQTGMTYWYPGIQEVLSLAREIHPATRIIIGGIYATLCSEHARSLGADLVVSGLDLNPLWKEIGIEPDLASPPYWEGYPLLTSGVIKLTEGCPYQCTYCSVSLVYKKFSINDLDYSLKSLALAHRQGARDIVFYDDSLLFRWEKTLRPFLERLKRPGRSLNFHTPNALNANMINAENSVLMQSGGFKHYYLGFESISQKWQGKTGSKVEGRDLAQAVEYLLAAGADPEKITAYIIIGHPEISIQGLEESIRFASSLGIQVMLSEYSPIPGTPDGERCREWIDLDEPLEHNKTFFTNTFLGSERTQELKTLCREMNYKNRMKNGKKPRSD